MEGKQKDCIEKIVVDGCAITHGARCDYLLVTGGINYFVELKGTDLVKAAKQVVATITKLGESSPMFARIVAARVPKAGTDMVRALTVIKSKYPACQVLIASQRHIDRV